VKINNGGGFIAEGLFQIRVSERIDTFVKMTLLHC